MTTSTAMPTLPGYTYNPHTNRYFKTSPNQSSKPSSPPPPAPPKCKRPRNSSLPRLLSRSELHPNPLSKSRISALKLCSATPRPHMLQRGDSTGQVHFERESVFVHSDANADLHILHYPHPDTNMHTLWHLTSLDAYDYVPHIGVLATAREQGACTEVCLYAIHSDRVRRTNMIRVQRTGVECMSVYGYNGIVALGGERVVDVSWFPNVSGIGRPWPSSRCVLASDVTSVRVRDNTHPCVIGMRSGVVVCRDFSYELKEQSSFSCGRNRSIVDIQLSDRNDTYVSCAGNGRDNLALWDLRTPGRAAAVGFVGHKNAYKKLQFDVDGECGLVAAGGDDGMVRLWDRRWGGVPMGEIFVGGFVEEVRLVGWSQGLGGMWVRNQSDVYVLDCRGG